MTTITGTIDRILYQNQDNAWSVVMVQTAEGMRKANGIMPGLRAGMTARLSGEIHSTKYGEDLKATEFEEIQPKDAEGIEKYLASGLIKNIGPKLAHLIVTAFGDNTLHILDDEPERLNEVTGIGKKRIRSIIDAVKEQKEIRSIMIWLKRYDLSNGLAAKIYQTYGNQSIAILEENPYRLSDDIGGVGFRKADNVAMRLGIQPDSAFRKMSGIRACLEDAAGEGHTCLPKEELIQKASSEEYLSLPGETIAETLRTDLDTTVENSGFVYLPPYYYAEKGIANGIRRIQEQNTGTITFPNIPALENETGVTYSNEQKEAITVAVTSKMSVITGGPGTGKTVTTNAIIRELEKRDQEVLLCAPTGRAAKRMKEVTGKEAQTIHRLLGFTRGEFEMNENNPLTGDALIIDEASMIDTILMNHLIKAIPDNMRVVIVGDVDQLPSVGAGCILKDIIDSKCVPVTHLKEIYRQARGSDIIMNAHAVNTGRIPEIKNAGNTDFWFFCAQEKEKVADLVVDLVHNRIPKKFGYQAEDIQVLSPMKREYDPIGSTRLNRRLQEVINPDGEKIATKGETEFRVGDRIMQTKNDYDKGIFNGDLGVITGKMDETDEGKTLLVADFDGEEVNLSRSDLQNIDLAYACTVHKSQGSEYPVVILTVHDSQYVMLKRNLLYTGITRARKQCIIVGTRRAIAIACQNEDTKKRYTTLKDRLLRP